MVGVVCVAREVGRDNNTGGCGVRVAEIGSNIGGCG